MYAPEWMILYKNNSQSYNPNNLDEDRNLPNLMKLFKNLKMKFITMNSKNILHMMNVISKKIFGTTITSIKNTQQKIFLIDKL